MTFSIVARDPATGDLGVAVASKFLAVGAVVPWARAGVGAIATQALANVRYGPDGLTALRSGQSAADVLADLTSVDDGRADRQVGIVDAQGSAETYTGSGCLTWAGGRTDEGVAIQGNILTGPEVVDAMLAAYATSTAPFPDRLIEALLAGDRAGGDARGRESAALLVVRDGAGYGGVDDRWLDLRVDDHHDPVPELQRIMRVWRLYYERPAADDLLPIDETLATELRERLTAAGWAPGRDDAFAAAIQRAIGGAPRIGEARETGPAWDASWDAALVTWMGVANLEERTAAAGWIDPVVLEELRGLRERSSA
ncbi:MAG TPA: DUF1028 domain-containing protein [Candidatus Limnocylindrales bacterium]|nr:DUF1028 domain-containing protein [Candidatus Limnocylindrales bacterium]